MAAVNFLFQVIFIFQFVSYSWAQYIAIPKNNGKTKTNWDKKITTTDIYIWLICLKCL